jgi:hypothetical protein
MADCLTAAGISADAVDGGDLWFETAEPYRMWTPTIREQSPGEWGLGDAYDALVAKWDGEAGAYLGADGKPVQGVLFLGESDYSAQFQECLEQTGYIPLPPEREDPADELKQKQAMADAGSAWARCARDQGHPGARDPDPPVADGFKTRPTAKLPWSITAEELKALVLACPTHRVDAEADYISAMEDSGADAPEVPEPPMAYVEFAGGPRPEDNTHPEADRMWEYYKILYRG